MAARDRIAREDGLLLCPEGAATAAAWEVAVDTGLIEDDDRCVLFNCATGLKYPMPEAGATLDRFATINWNALKTLQTSG